MSQCKDKYRDQHETERVLRGERPLADSTNPRFNWLGHVCSAGTGLMDEALVRGATRTELERYRPGTVMLHLRHYRVEHGLTIGHSDGIFRFAVIQGAPSRTRT